VVTVGALEPDALATFAPVVTVSGTSKMTATKRDRTRAIIM
jgi:hypothetical protein